MAFKKRHCFSRNVTLFERIKMWPWEKDVKCLIEKEWRFRKWHINCRILCKKEEKLSGWVCVWEWSEYKEISEFQEAQIYRSKHRVRGKRTRQTRVHRQRQSHHSRQRQSARHSHSHNPHHISDEFWMCGLHENAGCCTKGSSESGTPSTPRTDNFGRAQLSCSNDAFTFSGGGFWAYNSDSLKSKWCNKA